MVLIMNYNNPHEKIKKKLNYFLMTNKIPNMIFHGSNGSGKKTILYNFLDKIYCANTDANDKPSSQKNVMKSNILSVNCCHGKGIKFIREELKLFAKMNVHYNFKEEDKETMNEKKRNCMNFKSIVLFNADYLTIDAQSALRRCIELFSHSTRFFIVVENIHKLLNPIVSRFCEIYVCPKLSLSNNHMLIVNEQPPGDTQLTDSFDCQNQKMNNDKVLICNKLFELINKNNTSTKGHVETAEYLYENGISALDVLEYSKVLFEKSTLFMNEMTNIEFFFYKVKGNYRCEKLILFYLLWKITFSISSIINENPENPEIRIFNAS